MHEFVVTQAILSAVSILCAVTIPAVTGALRSGLSGEICPLTTDLLLCDRHA